MRTKVICHMAVSLDGKIILDQWAPQDKIPHKIIENVYREIGADAWLIGRVTAEFYARKEPFFEESSETFPRTPWYSLPVVGCPCIVFDPHGKLNWSKDPRAEGNSVVVVLTEHVPDSYLAALRRNGVSYIFGGKDGIDIEKVLGILYTDLEISTLMLQGGAITNGIFHQKGLINEISLLVCPVLDGSSGTPGFIRTSGLCIKELKDMKLTHSGFLDEGVVWLRYQTSYVNITS